MILNPRKLLVLAVISAIILACNVTIPTEIAVPTGLPDMPTIIVPPGDNPPPQDQPSQPIPVTGIDTTTLIFFAFLALLAVIVLLGIVAMSRRREGSPEHGSDEHDSP